MGIWWVPTFLCPDGGLLLVRDMPVSVNARIRGETVRTYPRQFDTSWIQREAGEVFNRGEVVQ